MSCTPACGGGACLCYLTNTFELSCLRRLRGSSSFRQRLELRDASCELRDDDAPRLAVAVGAAVGDGAAERSKDGAEQSAVHEAHLYIAHADAGAAQPRGGEGAGAGRAGGAQRRLPQEVPAALDLVIGALRKERRFEVLLRRRDARSPPRAPPHDGPARLGERPRRARGGRNTGGGGRGREAGRSTSRAGWRRAGCARRRTPAAPPAHLCDRGSCRRRSHAQRRASQRLARDARASPRRARPALSHNNAVHRAAAALKADLPRKSEFSATLISGELSRPRTPRVPRRARGRS